MSVPLKSIAGKPAAFFGGNDKGSIFFVLNLHHLRGWIVSECVTGIQNSFKGVEQFLFVKLVVIGDQNSEIDIFALLVNRK